MSAPFVLSRSAANICILFFVRRAFIIAEPFPFEGISTRKLVLESAYFNVVTAYTSEELLESAKRFREVDAAVIHGELPGFTKESIPRVRELIGRQKPIVFLSTTGHQTEDHADVVLSSHDPQLLLGKMHEYFGPADTEDLVRRRL